MDWATRRKLQYFGVIVAFALIFFVIPFYMFIYKAPTCFDSLKNGSEKGIDCGGDCRLLCSAQIAEPVQKWDPRVFKVSDGTFSVLAYLENQNVTAEVLQAPYIFKLYDKDNVLVVERSGITFVPRGATFALYEGNINTGQRVPTRATFEFGKNLVWISNVTPRTNLSIESKALSKEDTTPRIDAVVKNNEFYAVTNLEFTAIIYDGQGNAVGASRTFVENLDKGEVTPLVFTWPQPFTTKSDVCDAPVDVALLLDRSGSMASLGSNPPQPLSDVKNAATFFTQELSVGDRVALISFANEATDDESLTANFETVRNAIDSLSILKSGTQNTNIADAIEKARLELSAGRQGDSSGKVMILLTDGIANRPEKSGDENFAERTALESSAISKQQGITMFTIGLGKDLNTEFLKRVASSTDEFYLAPTTKELTGIYEQIATKICKRRPAVIEIIPRVYPAGSAIPR
jgi:Mg-chelatase subunit ChlD